jgi:hypothetical protein
MAIRFGSGSDGSRNPLTPDEAAMARVLVNAIRNATDKIKVEQFQSVEIPQRLKISCLALLI